MATYRDFKKGDVRRYFLVLLTLATKRTVPATAVALEMSKGEVMQVLDHLTTQFGVKLEKEEFEKEDGAATWSIRSWGVLNEQAVGKFLSEHKLPSEPPAAKTTTVKKSASKEPMADDASVKPVASKAPAKKAAVAKKAAPAKKVAAKKAAAKKLDRLAGLPAVALRPRAIFWLHVPFNGTIINPCHRLQC
ncbi:hypothetical protein ACU4GI_33440 [Cupriavidus basilensis]